MSENKSLGLPLYVPRSKDGRKICATLNNEPFLAIFTKQELLYAFESDVKFLGLGESIELTTPEMFCELFEGEPADAQLIVDLGDNSDSWTQSVDNALSQFRGGTTDNASK